MLTMKSAFRGLVAVLLFASETGFAQQSFSANSAAWRLVGDEVTVAKIDGREALKIRSGLAFLDDVMLQDGTVEFDVYVSGDRAFVYLMFRGQSDQEYEDIYLRPHKSGLSDALQYSPVFQRQSAWQLYHGSAGTAPVVIPPQQWIHVKLALSGQQAQVWIGDRDEPAMTINHLGREPNGGWIALRGFVPPTSPAAYAGYFSNVTITIADSVDRSTPAVTKLPAGLIDSWRVSPAFDAPAGPVTTLPTGLDSAAWPTPAMQPNGVFEFLRSRPVPEKSRHWAVVAEATISSAKSQTCAIHLGYSDELTLSLNDQLLLYTDASYRFDKRRQDGVLHADQTVAFLALNKGDNKVRAVIADRFGGWGLTARLPNCEGVEIH